MKRTALLTATLAITLLVVASMVMAQPNPSVPNLINFQGRLTDNTGNPVANGAHTVEFYIYNSRTLGTLLWNETQNPTTTGGLFTTQLGLLNPLPLSLFEDYDSLFLEIVADAQLISPRTLFTSTPSTRVTNALEHRNPFSGIVDLKNFNSGHGIVTYGGDGLDQIWLYGYSWGELFMFDSDPANNLNVTLGANNTGGGPGGELTLRLGGTTAIDLNAGLPGDASVMVPTDAVNSGEILDEPGVSNSEGAGFFFYLTPATTNVVDSVDITIPAAGYVEVTCGGYLNLYHNNGTMTNVSVGSGKTRGVEDFVPGTQYARVAPGMATDIYQVPFSASRLYAEVAGTHRYYFHASYNVGTDVNTDVALGYIRAVYYPTLYGTATLARVSANSPTNVSDGTALGNFRIQSAPELTTITVADHNSRLETERAKQIADLEARIKNLETQIKTGQNPNLAPGTPRKER